MKYLPLYLETPRLPLETEAPLALDRACKRCALSENKYLRNACIPAIGIRGEDSSAGTVLIVGEGPGKQEDISNQPFTGQTGKHLREQVARHWRGDVVYDNATRCFAGRGGPPDKAVAACRGYLAGTYRNVKPARIVCLGAQAMESVLGRSPNVLSMRRAFAYASDETPVFAVVHPLMAERNRFVRAWFEQDLAYALTTTRLPHAPQWDAEARLIDRTTIERAVTELRAAEWVVYDCETSGAHHNPEFELCALAMVARGSESPWVWDAAALRDPVTRDPLAALLADPRVGKVGQNVKYDNLTVRCALGVEVNGVVFDTRLARKMQDGEADASLAVLAELVGMGGHKEEAQAAVTAASKLIRKAIKENDPKRLEGFERAPALVAAAMENVAAGDDIKRFAYGFVPRDTLLRYNARDTLSTAYVADLLDARFRGDGFARERKVWTNIVLPAYRAVERMEATGIAVDVDAIRTFSSYLELETGSVFHRLAHYGEGVNWASPKQVAELLFNKLRLAPDPRHTTASGGYSTSEDALEALRGQHPCVDDLLKYRQLTKLQSMNAAGLLSHVRADGRVHPNFNLDGARSGRLSSSDPNGQNIPSPSRDPKAGPYYGRMARDCFTAMTNAERAGKGPRKVLLQFDYSQLELRIAAALSGDPEMRAVFESGVDYHLKTAQMIAPLFKLRPEDVDKEHPLRAAAKVINFAVLYGKSDAGIAFDISNATHKRTPIGEATRVREAIMGKFKRLAIWIKERLAYARREGHCHTWWAGEDARTRSLYRIADRDDNARMNAERSAWNTPIQGTAADFCTMSLAVIDRWLEEDCVPARIVLSVHDSILIETEEGAIDEVYDQTIRIMQGWPANGVPIVADCEIGHAWGSLRKVKAGTGPREVLRGLSR